MKIAALVGTIHAIGGISDPRAFVQAEISLGDPCAVSTVHQTFMKHIIHLWDLESNAAKAAASPWTTSRATSNLQHRLRAPNHHASHKSNQSSVHPNN